MSIERIHSQILKDYSLCDFCIRRQFPLAQKDIDDSSNDKVLNLEKRKKNNQTRSCFICGHTMSSIQKYTDLVINTLRDYEFTSLVIGARIPTAIIEREDNMRAELKLKGGETLKSNFTRNMNTAVSQQLKREVNHKNPDVTVIIDLLLDMVEISSRSIYVYGRYIKNKRGIPQKQRKCQECKGEGCPECELTGYTTTDSVEQRLTVPLLQLFNANRIKFSWIGSEDTNSLVLGNGRPFYAEILEPKIRKPKRIKSALKKNDNDISLIDLNLITKRTRKDRQFTVNVRSSFKLNKRISKIGIKNLQETFKEASLQIMSSNKNITKKIYHFT
ncbi:tRNA pseudouridine(54/55) synthase Pus10, partial [Thermoproteota archaeon]